MMRSGPNSSSKKYCQNMGNSTYMRLEIPKTQKKKKNQHYK